MFVLDSTVNNSRCWSESNPHWIKNLTSIKNLIYGRE